MWSFSTAIHVKLFQIFSNTALVRPLAAVPSQTQIVSPAPAQLSAVRSFQTTSVTKDIDSAAKFIGAGAATVGVAGSGKIYFWLHNMFANHRISFLHFLSCLVWFPYLLISGCAQLIIIKFLLPLSVPYQ